MSLRTAGALASMAGLFLGVSTAQAQPPAEREEPPVQPPPEAPTPPKKPDAPPLAFDLGNGFVLTPSGQFMARFRHHEGHDFTDGGVANTMRHRARLGLDVLFEGKVGAFVQLQDVRIWGEERNTLGDFSADGFDLHQGYARVLPVEQLELRLGRQEINFENQRLIGAVGWQEQARSFDAFHVSFRQGVLQLQSFYAKVGEDASATLNANGQPFFVDDIDLLASNLHIEPIEQLGIGLIVIGEHNSNVDRTVYTAGGILQGKPLCCLSLTGEGYYQFGSAGGDVTHSAWLAAAAAKVTFGVATKPFVEAFGDFVSGDDDSTDGTVQSFDTLYATNHKFYGEMDFFLNLPAHTDQRGLRDVGGRLGFTPAEPLNLMATYHWLGAMETQGADEATFGHEVDVKAVFKPWKPFTLDALYGLFVPGDIFEAGVADPKPEHFVYVTADAKF